MQDVKIYKGDTSDIYHGDCLLALKQIPDSSVDLIFADPPYNIGKKFGDFKDVWPSDVAYAEWCYQWLESCIRKLKPTGSLYVMTSTQAMPYLDLWLRDRLNVLSRIVWHYDSSGVQAKKYFGSLYEPILFCTKDAKNYTFNVSDIEVEARTGAVRKLMDYRKEVPTPYKTTKVPGNTWYIPRVRYRMSEYEEHPSQKPEALLERVIKASSNLGDVVLDPFGGTFTTCAVAQRLGRRAIGIELQADYVKIGLRRLGIATHFNGEALQSLDKTYVRKNANGVRGGAVEEEQTGYFLIRLRDEGYLDSDTTIVLPDKGATKKLDIIKGIHKGKIIVADKVRIDGKVKHTISENPSGKVLVLDDICDGGATFLSLSGLLTNASHATLAVSHGIFSKGLVELLDYYDDIVCYNNMSGIEPKVGHYANFNVLN